MQPRHPHTLLLSTLLFLHTTLLSPAGDAPPESEAIRRQAAEVERLQQELNKARQSLQQLRQDQPTSPTLEAPTENTQSLPTTPTLETAIPATQLARLFLSNPETAANRYQGKAFRIQGSVEDFGQKRFVRSFFILLKTETPDIDLRCQFSYVDDYRKVYTDKRERQFLGESPNGVARVLASKGQTITIQGKCTGLKGDILEFKDCSIIP
jgi:hypothetical protein